MKKGVLTCALLAAIILAPFGIRAYELHAQAAATAAFAKVRDSQPALSAAEVTGLLGQPAHIDESESTSIKGAVYYYPRQDGRMMKIVLVNDRVFHAEYVTEKKS